MHEVRAGHVQTTWHMQVEQQEPPSRFAISFTTNNSRYASPHSRYSYARNQKVGNLGIGPQHRMDVQNLHPDCPFSRSVLVLTGDTTCRGSLEFKVPSSVALSARLIDLHPCDVLHPPRHTPLCAPDRAVCRPACQESHLSSDLRPLDADAVDVARTLPSGRSCRA